MNKIYKKILFINALIIIGIFSSFTIQAQFITKWRTKTPNESITIPTTGSGYNYNVDWGDGSSSKGQTGDAKHSYVVAGIYAVSITGTFPRIYINNNRDGDKIIDISQWGKNAWASMNLAFYGCAQLDITATDAPILTAASDLSYMFSNCTKLNPSGAAATAMNTWNTSSIKDMSGMFNLTNLFNVDISGWNTSAVTRMFRMFFGATNFNQDIGKWNVSAVTNMAGMFTSTYAFNQDLGNWNTAAVTDMSSMFEYASAFNQTIGSWNTGSVTNMYTMFNRATNFNQDISKWNTASVTNMYNMFNLATSFNQDIGDWNTGAVTTMGIMFNEATAFDQNLGRWNIGNVASMPSMLNNSGLSISNYDSTLIGWARQTHKSNVNLGALNLKYCGAADVRTSLITTYGWKITGDALSCTMPVELISFIVQKSGKNSARINWASGVESNIESMTIEHCNNTMQWETIYTCPPKGSNSNYEAFDAHPVPGDNYYRLLTTDKDGSKKYSDVKLINFPTSLLPNVYPNPTTGSLTVNTIKTGDMIVLTDVTGRQILKKTASAETEILDIHSLAQGMYFISIIRDGKIVLNNKIRKGN